MFFYSQKIRRLLKKWPGKRYFGDLRILPLFFLLGACLEYSMINWSVGQVSFYRVYKRRKIEEVVNEKLHENTPIVSEA